MRWNNHITVFGGETKTNWTLAQRVIFFKILVSNISNLYSHVIKENHRQADSLTMHSAQSQENLSRLINFLRLREKDFVFFEFTSLTEFTPHFLGKDFDPFDAELFFEMNELGMPFAQIHWDENEHEILYYIDDFSSYWYDLTADKMVSCSLIELPRERTNGELVINEVLLVLKPKQI